MHGANVTTGESDEPAKRLPTFQQQEFAQLNFKAATLSTFCKTPGLTSLNQSVLDPIQVQVLNKRF